MTALCIIGGVASLALTTHGGPRKGGGAPHEVVAVQPFASTPRAVTTNRVADENAVRRQLQTPLSAGTNLEHSSGKEIQARPERGHGGPQVQPPQVELVLGKAVTNTKSSDVDDDILLEFAWLLIAGRSTSNHKRNILLIVIAIAHGLA